MEIRVGYRIEIITAQPTPGLLLLDPHPSRDADIVSPPRRQVQSIADGSQVPVQEYTDGFGNRCRRLVVPQGGAVFTNDMIVRDSGIPDQYDRSAPEIWPSDLPSDVIEYTLSSR